MQESRVVSFPPWSVYSALFHLLKNKRQQVSKPQNKTLNPQGSPPWMLEERVLLFSSILKCRHPAAADKERRQSPTGTCGAGFWVPVTRLETWKEKGRMDVEKELDLAPESVPTGFGKAQPRPTSGPWG